MAIDPITRREMFMAKAGGQNVNTPTPVTREEMLLSKIGGASSWNDLKDKPFYESTEVLFDQRVEFQDMDGMLLFMGEFPEFLEAGKTYTVTYNGVAYECAPVNGEYLGNMVAGGGDNTGEPFVIMIADEEGDGVVDLLIMPIDGNTSATVKIEKSVIHPIDPKFLPGGGGGGVVEIPITWNDEQDDFTVGKTFAEIREAIDSGSVVVLKDNVGDVYYLQSDEGGYLVFMGFYTSMNSRVIARTFVFDSEGYEGFYSEQIDTTQLDDIIHSGGGK